MDQGSRDARSARSKDPYSLAIIRFDVRMRTSETKLISSHSHRALQRLGDAAAIGLLKVLTAEDLLKPATIRDILPMLRQAFSNVNFIREPTDRLPTITMLMLSHLLQTISDDEAKTEIRETIAFVTRQVTV